MRKHEDYLALAYQAEQADTLARSHIARNCWLNLAGEYRKLAAQQLEREHHAHKGRTD